MSPVCPFVDYTVCSVCHHKSCRNRIFAPTSTNMPISASELENSKPEKEIESSSSSKNTSLKHVIEVNSNEFVDLPDLSYTETSKFFDAKAPLSTVEESSILTLENLGKIREENQTNSTEGEEIKKRQGVFYHHPYSLVGLTQLDAILPLSVSNSPISYKEQLTQAGLIKFQDFYLDQEDEQTNEPPKTYRLIIVSMLVVILLLTGSLIPSVFFSIRGSPLAFWNHFKSLSPVNKVKISSAITNLPLTLPSSTHADTAARAFKGVTYLPTVSLDGKCIYTLEKAIEEVVQLSLVTNKIRTYNTYCHTIDYLVEATENYNLDMKIAMGIWISDDENENAIQIEDAKSILQKYHPRHFDYIFVGNEVLFRNDLSQNVLIGYMNDLQSFLQTNKVNIPVGTCEISECINKDLIRESQVIGVNVHPFLTGLEPKNASKWVAESLLPRLNSMNEFDTQIIVAEIGWPYDGEISSITSETLQVQDFMGAWICHDGAKNDSLWYYFEAFDQPGRKRKFYGSNNKWEADWGIFGVDGKLKPGSTIPTCQI